MTIKELAILNKKTFVTGIIAILLIAFILISQKLNSSSSTQQPTFKMDEHIAQTVVFYSKVIGNSSRTQVYIPFSFKTEKMPLVLGFQQKDETMKDFLVFHPQLSFLDWHATREGELTLYQKSQKYTSLSEFLENPTGKIAADSRLIEKYPKLNADLIHFSNDIPINIDKYDYILSTQTALSQGGTTYYYKNIIDTSDALINAEDQITWVVRVSDADENHRFYLGNIDIVYLH